MSRYRIRYSIEEEMAMLKFLESQNLDPHDKRAALRKTWELAEQLHVTEHSAESMRNHFRRLLANQKENQKYADFDDKFSWKSAADLKEKLLYFDSMHKRPLSLAEKNIVKNLESSETQNNVNSSDSEKTDTNEDQLLEELNEFLHDKHQLYEWLDNVRLQLGVSWTDSLHVLRSVEGDSEKALSLLKHELVQQQLQTKEKDAILVDTIRSVTAQEFICYLRLGDNLNLDAALKKFDSENDKMQDDS